MLTTIVFLAILTTAVVVHELAHYFNAKSVGLPVRAFSVGMGPVLWRRKWRGTEWRLAALPIGGYVDIPGMAPKQDAAGNLQHPDEGFATKTWLEKIWVLVGGVIANYFLAVLLLAIVITTTPGYRTITAGLDVEVLGSNIAGVVEGMTAESLGVQAGDKVLFLNGISNPTPDDITSIIQTTEGELAFTLERSGQTVTIATAWPPDGTDRPLFGIQIEGIVETPPTINFVQATAEAASFSLRIVPEAVRGFVRGFGSVFTGQQSEDIAGPVGIVNAVNEARQIGIIPVLALAALINLSLAIFNLLPIPGLDGGRMLLTTITALRGKPFRPGQEEMIHFLGVMAVLAFMVLITFNELSGLFRG